LAVLARPIIAVIYQHGRFTPGATAQTALCLQAYAIGLAGYAAVKVLAPAFYAFGDSRTPMYVALFSVVVNATLNSFFTWKLHWGPAGLALSTSVIALTNLALLLIFMRRKIQRLGLAALLRSVVKVVAASAVMSVAAWYTHVQLVGHRYLDLAGSIAVAVVVFGAACRLLRVEEFDELRAALRLGTKQTKP
jgi:putative peptidoglycan lipid II flippase